MYGYSVLLLIIVVTYVQGFFFLLEKKQAFYCSKVCPLYCPELSMGMDKADGKRSRRHAPHYEYYEPDMTYEEFPPYVDADDFEDFPYFYPRFHHKKTTTTTTEKPTTTEEPTLICQVCKKKCKD